MGLLTLTCQMARRQEAAGMGDVAIRRRSRVTGAYRSAGNTTVSSSSNQTNRHAEANQNYNPAVNTIQTPI